MYSFSGATIDNLEEWKKETRISFKERNWISLPIAQLDDDVQDRIYVDSRSLIGVMNDMIEKIQRQGDQILTLNTRVADLTAAMVAQTKVIDNLTCALTSQESLPTDPIANVDNSGSNNSDLQGIMSWSEVTKVLMESPMTEFLFNWYDMQVDASYSELSTETKKKEKTIKSRYVSVKHFIMSASNASETTIENTIGSKPKQGGESMLQWKNDIKIFSDECFRKSLAILVDNQCIETANLDVDKISYTKFRRAIEQFKRKSRGTKRRAP